MSDDKKPASEQLPVSLEGQLTADDATRTLVFQMDMPIRWGDMDAMNHVNNTIYFQFFEQLRISWFEALGIGLDASEKGPVIINTFCSFLQELRYPGTVRARLSIGQIGRSSLQTFADLSRVDDPDTIYATGGAKVVWIDYPTRKSSPIPIELRARMSKPAGLLADS